MDNFAYMFIKWEMTVKENTQVPDSWFDFIREWAKRRAKMLWIFWTNDKDLHFVWIQFEEVCLHPFYNVFRLLRFELLADFTERFNCLSSA